MSFFTPAIWVRHTPTRKFSGPRRCLRRETIGAGSSFSSCAVRNVNLWKIRAPGCATSPYWTTSPEELAGDMLWAAHIHVITMSEGWQGIVVPSKLYGILQTGAPDLVHRTT